MNRGDIAAAAQILADTFSQGDPPALALGFSPAEMLQMLLPLMNDLVDEQLSIVACELNGNQRVVGCLLNERFGNPPPAAWDQDILNRFSPVFALLEELDSKFFAEHSDYDAAHYVHEFMLGSHPACGGRGIGSGLLQASQMVGKARGLRGAIAEATGPISQHVFVEKFGYSAKATVAYQSFEFQGSKPFASITQVTNCVLVVKDY
jgi:hypothetical protein